MLIDHLSDQMLIDQLSDQILIDQLSDQMLIDQMLSDVQYTQKTALMLMFSKKINKNTPRPTPPPKKK